MISISSFLHSNYTSMMYVLQNFKHHTYVSTLSQHYLLASRPILLIWSGLEFEGAAVSLAQAPRISPPILGCQAVL